MKIENFLCILWHTWVKRFQALDLQTEMGPDPTWASFQPPINKWPRNLALTRIFFDSTRWYFFDPKLKVKILKNLYLWKKISRSRDGWPNLIYTAKKWPGSIITLRCFYHSNQLANISFDISSSFMAIMIFNIASERRELRV